MQIISGANGEKVRGPPDDFFEDELNMPNLIIKIQKILNIALANYKNRHLAKILKKVKKLVSMK